MNNGLVDEEKNFIVPLVVIGIVAVAIMLIAGLFMPTTNWVI
jgi:hypothetical protein